MGQPIEAYRAGYEKGQKDTVGGVLAEITMGMLRDDPGGHFAAGYYDGRGGKKFSPPQAEGRKEAAELNPFDDKIAIKTICPNCGALDWFEWKFLGRLTDPICGHSWYADSGTYALIQVRAAFQFGRRFAKYMTSGISVSAGAGSSRANPGGRRIDHLCAEHEDARRFLETACIKNGSKSILEECESFPRSFRGLGFPWTLRFATAHTALVGLASGVGRLCGWGRMCQSGARYFED